jgi:hypothetical protein
MPFANVSWADLSPTGVSDFRLDLITEFASSCEIAPPTRLLSRAAILLISSRWVEGSPAELPLTTA